MIPMSIHNFKPNIKPKMKQGKQKTRNIFISVLQVEKELQRLRTKDRM